MKIDTSRIDDFLLRENDLLLLNIPTKGLIPLRVKRTQFYQYLYDPLAEGQLTAELPPSTSVDGVKNLGFISPELLKSRILPANPTNVFAIEAANRMYQVFIGLSPSYVRLYRNIPKETSQARLEITGWSSAYTAAGFIDGFTSPLTFPSPKSEIIIVKSLEIALGYANPLPEPISPLLMFYVNHMEVSVIADVDLIMEMLDKRGRGEETKIKTLGGLSEFSFETEFFKIKPIPLGAKREDVIKAVRGG